MSTNAMTMSSLPSTGRGLAVITGATGGMGRAVTLLLASAGWPLLLCDVDAARLGLMASDIRSKAAAAEIIAGDIAGSAFAAQFRTALIEKKVGIFIHTAGLSPTMGDGARILSVNFDATLQLVDIIRPHMAQDGCAILIASSAAHMVKSEELDQAITAAIATRSSNPLQPWATRPELAYPAAKRAVIALVAHEAAAFGRQGARIVSISPGLIDTPMARAEQSASPQMAQLLARTPLQRLGTAEEIASVAVFLCSAGASYVTGCDIRVDGGTLAALGL